MNKNTVTGYYLASLASHKNERCKKTKTKNRKLKVLAFCLAAQDDPCANKDFRFWNWNKKEK